MSESVASMDPLTLYTICIVAGFILVIIIVYFLLNSKINSVKSAVERECADMRTIVNKQNQILQTLLGGPRGVRPPPPNFPQPAPQAPPTPTPQPAPAPAPKPKECTTDVCPVEEPGLDDSELDAELSRLETENTEETSVQLEEIDDGDDIVLED